MDRPDGAYPKYYHTNIVLYFSGLRKVYPYYFTFTTFTKGRWVGEKILDVFGREFRAHPVEEYVSFSTFPLRCQAILIFL